MDWKVLCAAGALLAPGMNAGAANMIDGTKSMLCASTSAMLCEPYKDCKQGPAEAVNLPLFMRVNPESRSVESISAEGQTRTSKMTSMAESGDHLVMHGSDSGLAWSASVSKATGKMVVTGGRDNAFIVFGACTTR